ncbi:MAG: M14 family metallopeptidase [Patescibacteria group bacterium]|nr:M14 family metallopeptidase [bacterium]MDZ4227394.1 M14 family metallopeptidase [Patescibacteria group bacterium]
MKNIIIVLLVLIIAAFGGYFLIQNLSGPADVQDIASSTAPLEDGDSSAMEEDMGQSVIGTSVEGRDIIAYHYGTGDTEVLFVGGIHGGYSWNTALVAREMMDYMEGDTGIIPANVKVTVIPALNPDGLYKVAGTSTAEFTAADVASSQSVQVSGRFNANNVDLNRNFDCDWQESGKWRNRTVSGGSESFSEPESRAIKNYVETHDLAAVVVWYSAAGGVFASSCHNGVLPETLALTNAYAAASGYKAYEDFDFYEITGDMVNWLAKKGVPAISVLLTNHTDTERTKNQAGIKAVMEHYTQ